MNVLPIGGAAPSAPAPSRATGALAWFTQSRRALAMIWALFLLPRLAVILIDVAPTSDADWYYDRAAELAAGQGYTLNGKPTAFWPPGWPLALAAAFRLLGTSTLTVALLNLACAALTAWLVLALGRRIFAGQGAQTAEASARAGLLLLALYPNSIAYVPLALTEVLYTALLLGGCWLFVGRRSAWTLIPVGVIFGFAALVKAQTLVVVPLLFAIEWLRAGEIWRRMPGLIAQGALTLAAAAATIAPWTIRNHQMLGHWVTISTNSGVTLLTGNNDSAQGGFTPDDPLMIAHEKRGGDLDEVAYDAEARRKAMAWIEANPGKFAALMPRKIAHLWLPDGEGEWAYQGGHRRYAERAGLFRAVRIANQAYYAALMLAFAAAFAVMLRRRLRAGARAVDWWLLPYGIALYPSLIAMVFSGQSRFHYPVMPFVCLMAGWLLAHAWRSVDANRLRARDKPAILH